MWVALALNHDHREQPATVDEVMHPTRYKDQGQPSTTGIRRKQILDKTQFQRWKVWPGDEIRGGNAFLNWKKKIKKIENRARVSTIPHSPVLHSEHRRRRGWTRRQRRPKAFPGICRKQSQIRFFHGAVKAAGGEGGEGGLTP